MAKQESFIKMRGKVGDLSFSKHRSRGYEVREKGGVDKQRILSDPNFQRTRENMTEFGAAAAKAKQIRMQLNNLIRGIADNDMRNRLTSRVHRILKQDSESARGMRVFKDENSEMLKGFEVNSRSSLEQLFGVELHPTYDRSTGVVSLEVESFEPTSKVLLLEGATHMQFVLAAAQLGDREFLRRPDSVRSEHIQLIDESDAVSLEIQLDADLPDAVYIMVGISMFQKVNGDIYPLKNGMFNALTIVAVDLP